MTCIFPKCKKKCRGRGLCEPHYMVAYRLVKYGKTTWESLEKRNKSLPIGVTSPNEKVEWFLEGEE